MFRSRDKSWVKQRLVECAVETVCRVVLRSGYLLNEHHGLDAGVEVGRVSDLENGVQLFLESVSR